MDTQSQNRLSIIGLLCFFVPVAIWGLWIYAFSSNENLPQEDKVAKFLSYFPGFLQSTSAISKLVLISAIASIVLCVAGRKKADSTFKVLGVFVIVISSLITLLQLFTMM